MKTIIESINKENTVADIGTDHAYIPIRLIQDKRCSHVIASDIRQGPVEAARHSVEKYNLSKHIEIRKGSGLSTLSKGEADVIIISGMGGILISQILSENIEIARSANRLILQPMNAQYELRHFLEENGFPITGEDLASEGFKVYNFIFVTNTEKQSVEYKNEIDYHLPPCLYENKHFKALREKKRREFTKILAGQSRSSNPDKSMMDYCKKRLNEINTLTRK